MPNILWSMVMDWCPCHGRTDCEVATRKRFERERILAALEELDVTPAPVLFHPFSGLASEHIPPASTLQSQNPTPGTS